MKVKIKLKETAFFIIALSLMQITSIDYISRPLGIANDVLRCVAALVVLLRFFFHRRTRTSTITVLLMIMMGELLLSTLMSGGSFKAWFVAAASIISFGMLFEMSLARSELYINPMMLLMESLSYVHLLLILLFPNGLYEYNGSHVFWLFGQKNLALPYLLIAYVTAFYYGSSGGNKLREAGVYIAGIISSVLVHSSTSTVGLILLTVLFFLVRRGMKFNIVWLLGVNLALFFVLVVFRLQVPVIKYFIENVLHKTATLTGRDVLWDMALFYIRKKPIFGYGLYGASPKGFSIFGSYWNLYAHNQILQELFDGGIVQLLLYLGLLLIICWKLNKYHDGLFVQCMIVTLFALNIMFITEAYRAKILYLIYYYAYFSPNIESIRLNRKDAKIRPR